MGSTALNVAVGILGVLAGFLAWTPQPLPESHWSDEPFEWPVQLQYRPVRASSDLTVQCYSAGPAPADAPKGAIVFAHGFPETAASWRDYVLHFGSQGYHALACDLHHVNNSASTRGQYSYTLDGMADDLKGIADSTGQDKVVVIGHE